MKAALVIAALLALAGCANSPSAGDSSQQPNIFTRMGAAMGNTYAQSQVANAEASKSQAAYEQSVADYRACLTANPNHPAACESKREAMDAQEHLWTDLRCSTYGGGPMCNTVSANVNVQSSR